MASTLIACQPIQSSNAPEAMDATAITLCMDNELPIVVFDLMGPDNLRSLLEGEAIGTLVSDGEGAS